MRKNILWLFALLFPFMGLVSCSSDDDIVFDHERQQFETRADRILLEFIAPSGTTPDEDMYIIGPFNGNSLDADAEGNYATPVLNDAYKLMKAENNNMKWGVYLDPSTFQGGKTLADGFRFYSVSQGHESLLGDTPVFAVHRDNPALGTFTNVWGQRWESFYWSNDDGDEDEGYIPYLDNADEESIFFETDAEYVRIWCWGGVGEAAALKIESADWNLRPFMEKVGKTKSGKNVFKFVFGGAPTNFLLSISDADGNQIGSDDDRPIKGAVYTKNGYYIDGHNYDGDDAETPEVITRVGPPSGNSGYIPYLDNADEESIFFETDAEYVRIWCWGGVGEAAALKIESADWNLRPFMEKVGKTKSGKNVFKFVFGGAPTNFLLSISDADGNQIGSDDDRPIKGAVYTKNGYYIDGHNYDGDDAETPEVITQVGKPASSGGYTPTINSADEESVFFESDAEYVRIWCWGGVGEAAALKIESADWNLRPFMEKVGKTKSGKNVFKFVFGGAPTNFLLSISDADGNQIGSDDDRPIKGAVYTKNGYYIDGHNYDGDDAETPTVITKVK